MISTVGDKLHLFEARTCFQKKDPKHYAGPDGVTGCADGDFWCFFPTAWVCFNSATSSRAFAPLVCNNLTDPFDGDVGVVGRTLSLAYAVCDNVTCFHINC
jgi:hypothetical protein